MFDKSSKSTISNSGDNKKSSNSAQLPPKCFKCYKELKGPECQDCSKPPRAFIGQKEHLKIEMTNRSIWNSRYAEKGGSNDGKSKENEKDEKCVLM